MHEWVKGHWYILNHALDSKKLELLFITAESAGLRIGLNTRDSVWSSQFPSLVHEQIFHAEGNFICASGSTDTKPDFRQTDYQEIMDVLREIIKENSKELWKQAG